MDKMVLVDTGNSCWNMPYDIFGKDVAPLFKIAMGPKIHIPAPFAADCYYCDASSINAVNAFLDNNKNEIKIPLLIL